MGIQAKLPQYKTDCPAGISHLKNAYRTLFRSKVNLTEAIALVRSEGEIDEEVEYLLNFIENSNRGIGV